MSAMSASSGLMPLSLISEHKTSQGGPPPVQPLSFASEKHPLVQAPKPTPNGMEPSPPLVPVLPPPQPDSHPSLPCGGVSEPTSEEERSGGAVPEVEPVEPPPPAVPAVPEQPPATEPAEPAPAPEPLLSKAHPLPSSAQPSAPPSDQTPSLVQSGSASSALLSPPSQAQQTQQIISLPPEANDAGVTQVKPQPLQSESQSDQSQIQPSSDNEKTVQPESDAQSQVKPSSEPQVEKEKSESQPEKPQVEPPKPAPQQQSKPETAISVQTVAATSTGRPSKRTKNSNSVAEKKSATAPVVSSTLPQTEANDDKKAKRKRLPTQVYQSPIPELNIIAKMSKPEKNSAPDDKLIVFYRNEFLAVRNAEGGFYVCQAMQNVYKTSSRIRIRWLSQVANTDHYSPDFYDNTEFDCILTNLNLERIDKNKYRLPIVEEQRTQSILKRAIDVEKGIAPPDEATVTEEHPDGLDLSLYRNEEQLKKRKRGSKNKINKKKVKKVVETEAIRKNREPSRRKAIVDQKKVNLAVTQQKRVARVPGKVEKPVVQRIVAAKKMGRRKISSSPVSNKPTSATAVRDPTKKKEINRGVPLKRKSEPQPAPIPEKKVKTGASKTRNL